ncbi:MAG: hypothetical protein ACREFY_12975 [Acetobacteraceae bacterium]
MLLAGLVLIGGTGAIVVHVRRTVVPPGCRDPRVLRVVRHALTGRFGLPKTVRMETITTRAGGPLAFRFVCTATLGGLDHVPLPPGSRPGSVAYVSSLAGPARRLDVTVSVQPLLTWVPVR